MCLDATYCIHGTRRNKLYTTVYIRLTYFLEKLVSLNIDSISAYSQDSESFYLIYHYSGQFNTVLNFTL